MISNCSTKRPAKGFSLAETAIVLGVVGVILAGLWSVVDTTRESSRQGETISQMVQTVENVRDAYKYAAGTATGDLTSFLIGKNAILSEMVRRRTAPFTAGHLWGGGGTFRVLAHSTGTSNFFMIELNTLPQEACIGLAAKLTGAGGPTGLREAQVNGTATPTPIAPDTAAGLCDSTSTNVILLTYRLRA